VSSSDTIALYIYNYYVGEVKLRKKERKKERRIIKTIMPFLIQQKPLPVCLQLLDRWMNY